MENKPDMGMDAVDEKQQRQIDALRHIMLGVVIIGVVLIIFAAIFVANREISCPHKECPHYVGNAGK